MPLEPYTGTDQKLIDDFIDKLKKIFKPEGTKEDYVLENFVIHEYYFRSKLYHVKLNEKQLDELVEFFMWSLVGAGEPVGMKAALCMSEALTQASLKAIHGGKSGASADNVVRTAGIDRFQEILSGNKPKNSVITIKLYKDDKESCIEFSNEQETFYLKDIMKSMRLVVCDKLEDAVVKLHPKLDLNQIPVNYWYINSIWDISEISGFNVHVCDVIDRLMKNYDEIMFITGKVINNKEFGAYIYFKPGVKQERIIVILEEWNQERASTIIRGGYLKRCYVSENKNNPGHFIIEANEVNENVLSLENLIYDERVDPFGCRTTDIEVSYKLFGINEACSRVYEELLYAATNLSETKKVLSRHYKVLADTMLAGGIFRYATRGSLKADESMDPLKLVAFETPRDMLKSVMKNPRPSPIADPVSASVFGELPTLGTGITKIILYQK